MESNNKQNGNKPASPNRRRLLQAAGIAATFPGIRTGIELNRTIEGASPIGRVHFIESVIVHEDAPHYPRTTSDAFPKYLVDPHENRLVLTNVGRSKTKQHVRQQLVNNDAVVYGQDFHPLPASVFGTKVSSNYLTLDANYSRGAVDRLLLEKPITPPTVQIKLEKNEGVAVAVEGMTTTLESKSETALRLDKRQINYRVPIQVDETDGRDDKTTKDNGPHTELRKTSVTPVVKIRNNGVVDVYDVEVDQ